MADSFFTGKDLARLYAGSKAFSAKISADPEAVGLTSQIAAEYAALDAIFAILYLAAASPNNRTRGVIIGRNEAAAVLRKRAALLAKTIDGTATVTDQQRADLGLNVRKAPSPRPAPGRPSDFGLTLDAVGAIELRWKCKNAKGSGGTLYEVLRRDAIDGLFRRLATVGQKRFRDATFPAGTTSLTYMVRGIRSNSVGDWAQHNVTFGGGAGSAGAATVARVAA